MSGLYEPNGVTLEEFIRLCEVTGRELVYLPDSKSTGRIAVVPPMGARAKGGHPGELLRSLQTILELAFRACVAEKSAAFPTKKGKPGMKPASWPYVCDACGNVMLQTAQRSSTTCPLCGSGEPRRKVEIPWWGRNRYGRPPLPAAKKCECHRWGQPGLVPDVVDGFTTLVPCPDCDGPTTERNPS